MPLIDLKIQHGQDFEDAKSRLGRAVGELEGRFGEMIKSVQWSTGRDSVALSGSGFRLDVTVDARKVHVSGDLPLIATLMGGADGIKRMVESAFRKQINP